MGAIQIGGQWFYVQPDGTRLGPFPSRDSAVLAGGEAPVPQPAVAGGSAPTGPTAGGGAPGTYDPNNPIVGSSVPAAGGSLVYIGSKPSFPGDTVGTPQFQFVAGRTENPTVVVNDRLVDAVTGQVIADLSGASGTLSPNTSAQVAQQQRQLLATQQQNALSLAEQQRQFNEQFGADKAKFNITQQFAQQQHADTLAEAEKNRELQRGNTLLQLGSRPDTLIRYLFALRGQQPAQGLGVPPALPGYQNVAGVSGAAPAPLITGQTPLVAAGATPQPATTARPPVAEQGAMIGPGQSATIPAGQSVAAPGTPLIKAQTAAVNPSNFLESLPATDPRSPQYGRAAPAAQPAPSLVNPANLSPTLQPIASSVQFAPSGTQLGNAVGQNDALNEVRSREQYNAYQRSIGGKELPGLKYDPSLGRLYGSGGVIPEPVVGMGMDSGQMYMMGENAHAGDREVVVPEHKVPKDIFEKLMQDAQEVSYSEDKMGKRSVKVKRGDGGSGMNSYATGGMLGYKPIDPSVFNPPQISNAFNFPQIGNLTGGTSLVPSAQRLFDALPSERALFSGYLQDEVGAQPGDVFEMARRLAPQVTGLRAGRFVN